MVYRKSKHFWQLVVKRKTKSNIKSNKEEFQQKICFDGLFANTKSNDAASAGDVAGTGGGNSGYAGNGFKKPVKGL